MFGDNAGSTYNKTNLPKVSDTEELYFRLDFSSSPYELNGGLKYGNGEPLITKTIGENDWYVARVSDFPDSVISYGRDVIPIGEMVSKKYTVLINSSSGVQISTPKRNIMEYNNMDPNSSNPVPRPFVTKMILSEGNSIEVKKNGNIEKDGGGAWTLTQDSEGVWTFEVPAIDSNYEITVK